MRSSRHGLLVAVAGLALLGGALAAGRSVAGALVVTRVATAAETLRHDATGRTGLEALREQLLGLAGLEGALRIRVLGMELRGPGGTYQLDLTGEKTAGGAVALTLTLAPAGQPPALRVDARATPTAGAAVDARIEVAGEPTRLGALWPAALPAPPSIAARGDVRLLGGGVAEATGHVTLQAAVPAVLDFAGRYDAATGGLDISRWTLVQGDQMRLAGTARAEPAEAGVRAMLILDHGGVPGATVTVRSRAATLWPLDLEAQLLDAAAVAPLLPPGTMLAGSGRVAGEVAGSDGALRFRGVLDADVASAHLELATPVTLTAVRATGVPVYWNAGGAEQPGVLSVARLEAGGLAAADVTSSATLLDGLLRLPDLRYRHHGGQGSGWAEIAVGGPAAPLRARVEGERVDLAEVVREAGATLAQVTGRVRYTGSVQQRPGRGVDAVVQLRSQGGGEIGIEAIEELLASPAVEVESTGLLRQTLENLRVFEYESLEGELRAVDGQGTVNLSIRGRRRLGILPPPVRAINLRNVPLDFLAGTLDRGTPR